MIRSDFRIFLTYQNKPDNGQRHRASHPMYIKRVLGGKWICSILVWLMVWTADWDSKLSHVLCNLSCWSASPFCLSASSADNHITLLGCGKVGPQAKCKPQEIPTFKWHIMPVEVYCIHCRKGWDWSQITSRTHCDVLSQIFTTLYAF